MILRLLNPQGIAGLAASLCLALLLVLQKVETRHWKKQAASYEQLYRDEQVALAGTVANYRSTAEQAIQLDELIRWVEAQHAVDANAEPSRNR
jgi:hypothetical protein